MSQNEFIKESCHNEKNKNGVVKLLNNITYKNGDEIKFEYTGIPNKDVVDVKKTQELITKFFRQLNIRNLVENIEILKTILRDFDEKTFVFNYKAGDTNEIVSFSEYELNYYLRREKHDDIYENFEIDNDPIKGLNFNINNQKIRELYFYNFSDLSDKIDSILRKLYDIDGIQPIELDEDSKTLIEVYKIFYNENPDFSDSDINDKIQTMVVILRKFLIRCGDYNFSYARGKKMPISQNLSNRVHRLFPFAEVSDIDEPIQIPTKYQNMIQIIGEGIRGAIKDTNNPEDALKNISRIIYASWSCFPSENVNQISNFANCSAYEVESNLKLIKKLNNYIGIK